ncbi:MAG: ATP-binding protein [Lachnospiraceae bacterium]|nr:ATP-binding protein [Lachnospiraceae bacterium]
MEERNVDTNSRELVVVAEKENLSKVLEFVDKQLEKIECSMKAQMQIDIAVEEIFVNIASYAYHQEVGKATIRVEVKEEPLTVFLTFIDKGVAYDPLKKADPDVTLSAEEREIGGLGIFMVKKNMDDIQYEYKDGQNILTLKKKI